MNGTEFKMSEKEPIFGLAKINEKIRIVLGNKVISMKEFDTFEEAEAYIESKPYELIINTTILLIKFDNEKIKETAHKSKKSAQSIKKLSSKD